MNAKQAESARQFRALHESPGIFLVPNPWDAGSARVLASLGFKAFATSSAAAAGILGRLDGGISRTECLEQAAAIVDATDLPVSADLGKCFGDSPEEVAETIAAAAKAGLVGGSVEDATNDPAGPICDFQLSVERVRAGVEAARRLAFPFILVGRAENFLWGKPDLDDVIKRLVAFEQAGADVLFAPGLPTLAAVREVCSAVHKPVNFVAGARGRSFTVPELAEAGVKRISFGGSLFRASMTGLLDTAREALASGTFGYTERILSTADLNRILAG